MQGLHCHLCTAVYFYIPLITIVLDSTYGEPAVSAPKNKEQESQQYLVE